MLTYSRDPATVAKAYTEDSVWRNRTSFIHGQAEIEQFLTKKWQREKNYRLRKELVRLNVLYTFHSFSSQSVLQFAFTDNKIAVQFWYEFQDANDGMKWKRCYGLEDWTFAEDGRMKKRQMSGNDLEIAEGERWFAGDVDVNVVNIGEQHW